MDRCNGTTRSGTRCKRSASEGSPFCAMHADQARNPEEATPSADEARDCDPLEALVALAAAGVVLIAVLTVRRVFRFL